MGPLLRLQVWSEGQGKSRSNREGAEGVQRRKVIKSWLVWSLTYRLLECQQLLQPGVILYLRFYRSANSCTVESVGTWEKADIRRVEQTPYAVVIERASLLVNKAVVSGAVKVSIERVLTKRPAVYPNIQSLNKSLIIQAGQSCFVKENIFSTGPVRRLTLWMVRNNFFEDQPLNTRFSNKKVSIE